jgi:squalene synthase HpnC
MSTVTDVHVPNTSTLGNGDPSEPPTVEAAQRYCARLARSHYENFNVGGWITPKDKLPHVYTIYAWCRTVDDLGDETIPTELDRPTAEGGQLDPAVAEHRLSRLDWWEVELDAVYHGQPSHPVTIALQRTVEEFAIPAEPFLKLIQANRMDQERRRFPTLDDVLFYCQHSANPVGHLYLYLSGYADAERQHLADFTCTALQLTNFWQDVARDYRDRGRIYLPVNDMERFGVSEEDVSAENAPAPLRALLRYECAVAMNLFRQGTPLIDTLDRPARLPVALFTRGGVAVLNAIHRQGYDVLSQRPALSRRRKAWLLASAWLGNRLGRGYGLPGTDASRGTSA